MKTRSQKRKNRSKTRATNGSVQFQLPELKVDERVRIHGRSDIFPNSTGLVLKVVPSKHGQIVHVMLPQRSRLVVKIRIEDIIRNVPTELKAQLDAERDNAEERKRVYFFDGLRVSSADRYNQL